MTEPKFVLFPTSDGLTLPGLLYRVPKSKTVAVFLHGNGSSSVFYKDQQQSEIIDMLAKIGISSLLFNNRGAHFIKKITVEKPDGTTDRCLFGMAYEKIKECVEDIDAAVGFLKDADFREFFLLGESTGANKICVYNHYKPQNPFSKYILYSGGDDTGFYYHMLGKRKFQQLLEKARNKIRNGKGNDIMKELLPDELFAYVGFYDIANPDGDYNCFPFYEVIEQVKLSTKPHFRYFDEISKPSLILYGEQDEYAWGNVPKIVDLLRKRKPEFTYIIVKNADHGFHGKEQSLAKFISLFLP